MFSLGCGLGSHVEQEGTRLRHITGGYIQFVAAAYADFSDDDYLVYAKRIAATIAGVQQS